MATARPATAATLVPVTGRAPNAHTAARRSRPPSSGKPGSRLKIARSRFVQHSSPTSAVDSAPLGNDA